MSSTTANRSHARFGIFLAIASLAAPGVARSQVEQAWVARYDGPGGGDDTATALALDGDGNVYVTGRSYDHGQDTSGDYSDDYFTVKYSPTGEELWVARYDGPAGGDDYAWAIAVDGDGNAYVTGSSDGPGTGRDYATVKYSPEGEELWVKRYDGPAGGDDHVRALTVDSQGNVYVTGSSGGFSSFVGDYATVKYSPEGEELWVVRYDGPEGRDDSVQAIALDSDGNVYVTGSSESLLTRDDYATVKYSPEGDELWVVRYDGPAGRGDTASALGVDGEGNIYVTGSSAGSGTGTDYATVKYSPQGKELWVARHDGPVSLSDFAHALAVDREGYIYVTGREDLDPGAGIVGDYATVKYSPEGEELWITRYDGPAGRDDLPAALAVDDDGNVHVTGSSQGSIWARDYATVKYSPEGKELWAVRYDGPAGEDDVALALAVDREGHVYVTGGSGIRRDGSTVKYSPAGDELWVARYDGPSGGDDGAHSLATDSEGNVYVTGSSRGSGTGTDYATVKYSPEGDELWVVGYDGPVSGYDYSLALAAGGEGSIYVTGESDGSDSGRDYLTLKYSSEGDELWVARYDGPVRGHDRASALAVDKDGNLYVTGSSEGLDSGQDYLTLKYSPEGEELWVVRYDGPAGGYDSAEALALDNEGNLYVTGTSLGSGTGSDYATVKYSPQGEELWLARYDGPAGGDDSAEALSVDNDGNVCVTGSSEGLGTGRDYATLKYSPQGEELWGVRYGGPPGRFDDAHAIGVDSEGNVYVTGSSEGLATDRDYLTLKYSPAGEELWVARYDGPAGETDSAEALALDNDGNVYITGYSGGSDSGLDYLTLKYSPAGEELWVVRHDGPVSAYDWAWALAVDGEGNVYVAGSSPGIVTEDDMTTVKYSQTRLPHFRRGDCNDDGAVDIADPVATLFAIFLGEFDITCDDACDSNDDGSVNMPDAVNTLAMLFLGEGIVPAPGVKDCGVDPGEDGLGCEMHESCP